MLRIVASSGMLPGGRLMSLESMQVNTFNLHATLFNATRSAWGTIEDDK